MKKILIIDDDSTFVKTMRSKLENLGYSVREAHDGEEGVLATEKEKPDLILLDLVMPKLGGMGFLKLIQKDNQINKIPILITSNFSGDNVVSQGVEYGVKGYVIKSNESLETIANAAETIIGKP